MSIWFKLKRPEILIITTLLRAEYQGIQELQTTDIILKCGISKATLKQSLNTLQELGLIEQHTTTINKKTRTIVRLTEKGRRIAEKFMDIERELLKLNNM